MRWFFRVLSTKIHLNSSLSQSCNPETQTFRPVMWYRIILLPMTSINTYLHRRQNLSSCENAKRNLQQSISICIVGQNLSSCETYLKINKINSLWRKNFNSLWPKDISPDKVIIIINWYQSIERENYFNLQPRQAKFIELECKRYSI